MPASRSEARCSTKSASSCSTTHSLTKQLREEIREAATTEIELETALTITAKRIAASTKRIIPTTKWVSASLTAKATRAIHLVPVLSILVVPSTLIRVIQHLISFIE